MPHIRNIRIVISKGFIALAAVLLFSLTPATTFADDAPAACTPQDSTQAGVHYPTGSDAGTFTYYCDGPLAGLWANDYYTYDPATSSRAPRYDPNFGYNCTSGVWTMDDWSYSAAQGQYFYSRVATPAPVGYATNCPVTPSAAATTASPNTAANTSTNTTGPGSTNNADLNITNNTNLTNHTTAMVNNGITAISLSGNASVLNNTLGGSAATGDSSDTANVINLLQSSTNMLGSGQTVATFTANINGDVNGDLLFDPAAMGSLQNASGSTNISNSLTVNNTNNATLNNTIDLAAQSGDAAVSGNTTGGDATSGSARAIANVMNYINSAIMSGQSFIGTININGNLNGDILLPPDLIDQLIASNVPTVTVNIPAPGSTNSSDTTVNNDVTVHNTNNQNIDNNVTSSATTGTADVSGNTTAGSATSGKATTSVTAFNLTGSHVIGENNILVFVNVLGKWVGMIVNAPAGATAASLGGGITRNTTVNNTADLNNTNNFGINNDITVAAASGNASVTGNTKGGNARSGDASTAVNLLNVENSTFDLAGWFGILFINVFGSWTGSFGVNTSAGDPLKQPTAAETANQPLANKLAALPGQVFRFVPSTGTFVSNSGGDNGEITTENVATPQAVLAAATHKTSTTPGSSGPLSSGGGIINPTTIIGGLTLMFILGDAYLGYRRNHA